MESREQFQPHAPAQERSRNSIVLVLVLVLITAAAYWPAIHADFIWDDDSYVLNNPLLLSLDGLSKIWFTTEAPQYYPMVFTSFWIEYQLWDTRALGYHLTNILLHGITAALLWRILLRLKVPGSFFAAVVFALHPVCVESVAWITERKNVLCGVFFFSALLFWTHAQDRQSRPKRLLALAFYVFALLSKTVACTLAATLLLLQWYRTGTLTRRDLQKTLPFWIIGILFGLYTAMLESTKVGAVGAEWDLSIAQRILIAGRAVWFYAAKLVWPADLMFVYPRFEPQPAEFIQWLGPITAVGIVSALWLARTRIGRGPFTAVAFFVVTLAPALGFVNVFPFRFSFFADHFQYLAVPGVIVLVTATATTLVRKSAGPIRIRSAAVGGVAILTLLGALTFRHSRSFKNAETLYRDTFEANPAAWLASYNLAVLLYARGDTGEALRLFHHTVEIRPQHAGAWTYLGVYAQENDDPDRALEHYLTALHGEPQNRVTNIRLAELYTARGQHALAAKCYRVLLGDVSDEQLKSLDHETRFKFLYESRHVRRRLAWLLATSPDDSLRNGELALKLARQTVFKGQPDEVQALRTLAAAHAEVGRFDQAAKLARMAGELAGERKLEKLSKRISQELALYSTGRPTRMKGASGDASNSASGRPRSI